MSFLKSTVILLIKNIYYVTETGNCNPLSLNGSYYEIRETLANHCQTKSLFLEKFRSRYLLLAKYGVFLIGNIQGLTSNTAEYYKR